MLSFSPKSATERPPCPKCGASMLLTRIVPKKLGLNQRPYECVCAQSEHFDTECCSPMDVGSLWGVPLDGRLS